MKHFFLDASALAKRYAVEPGSPLLNRLSSIADRTRLSCLMLGAVEVVAALVRKRNAGLISIASLKAAVMQLETEVVNAVDFVTLPSEIPSMKMAIPLLLTHSINSSDGIILRTALDAAALRRSQGDDLVLMSSDQRLLKAAQAEGLLTFDPEVQTQAELDILFGP